MGDCQARCMYIPNKALVPYRPAGRTRSHQKSTSTWSGEPPALPPHSLAQQQVIFYRLTTCGSSDHL